MDTEKTQLNIIPTIPEEEQSVSATADPINHNPETPSQFNPKRENPHLQSDERPQSNASNTASERVGSA